MRFWALVVAGVILGATTTAAAAQGTPTPEPDPSLVVELFQNARASRDVDAALAQFADTAVITIQGRSVETFSGQPRLRAYMQNVGTKFQSLTRSKPTVQGNSVTWIERDQYGGQVIDATVVAIVSGGRIVSLTYRDNQAGLAAGASAGQKIPTVVWPVGLLLLSGGMLGFVFGRPRRKASRSNLDGRLMLALRRGRALD